MRKFLSSLMLGVMLALVSCSQDEPASIGGQEVDASFKVQLTAPMKQTRAAFVKEGYDLSDMRVIISVMYNNVVVDSRTIDAHSFGTDGQRKADFSFRLVTGLEYTVAIWADFGDAYYTVTHAIGSAPKVTMASTTITGSEQKYDAFFKIEKVTFNTTGEVRSFVLQRPFGLVRVSTTDYNEPAVKNAGLRPEFYQIASLTVPTELDLLTGTVSNNQDVTINGNCSDAFDVDANPKEFSFDYFLAGELQTSLADFSVKYSNQTKGDILTYSFVNIPVRRNYITNIEGNLLTKRGTLSITVNPTWEDGSVIPGTIEIHNDGQLKEAIANQADGQTWVIFPNDYDVSGPPTAQSQEPSWQLYADRGYQVSQFIINANNVRVIGISRPVIHATSNQPTVSLNGQSTILVRGNNVTLEGLDIHAIQYENGGGNKAVSIESADNFQLTNCTITPSANGNGGAVLFDGDFSGKTAAIKDTRIKGALSTRYMTSTGIVTVENVEVNSLGTDYDAPLSTNATRVVSVVADLRIVTDSKANLDAFMALLPTGATLKLLAGTYTYSNTDPGTLAVKAGITLEGTGTDTIIEGQLRPLSNVTIKNLQLSQPLISNIASANANGFAPIYFMSSAVSNLTLANLTFDTQNTGNSSANGAVAIYASREITIKNCIFYTFWKGFVATNPKMTITGNTFNNMNPGSLRANYGNMTITGNTFQRNTNNEAQMLNILPADYSELTFSTSFGRITGVNTVSDEFKSFINGIRTNNTWTGNEASGKPIYISNNTSSYKLMNNL